MPTTNNQRSAGQIVVRSLVVAAAFAILLGPQLVPPCGGRVTFDSVGHHCNRTFAEVSGLALVAIVIAGLSWFAQSATTRFVQSLFLGLVGGAVVVLPRPWALGICRRPDMACHNTELATTIPAIVLIVSAAVLAFIAVRDRQDQKTRAVTAPADPWDSAVPVAAGGSPPQPKRKRQCCG